MRRVRLLSIGVGATIALAACTSAAGAGSRSPTGVGAPTRQGSSAEGNGRPAGLPGVSGLVAEVTGSTAQVQTPSSQTAVTWSASTRFTEQSAATAAAVKVGECVIAVSQSAVSGGSGRGTPTPTPPPTSSGPTTQLAATSVEIFPATSTGCGFGPRAGGNGARRSGSGGTATSRPSGIPTARPSFTGGPRNGARFGATGTVTAVAASSFTVRSTRGPTGNAPQDLTVTWSSVTRFTTLRSASAAVVKVGVCLSATGKADATGAVTATAVTVSQPVNGSCLRVGAFGRGQPRPSSTAAALNG